MNPPKGSIAPAAAPDASVRAACLDRLATALSGFPDLGVTLRMNGPAPCLAVRNTTAPTLSETVTAGPSPRGDGLAFVWSWGKRISDVSDPDSAAHAIAYVLEASGARLGER